MTQIKICGVTRFEDALTSAEPADDIPGADIIGLNFYGDSIRSISREDARHLVYRLKATLADDCPLLIGVFVNHTEDFIRETIDMVGLDAAQLSGDELPRLSEALDGIAYKAIQPQSVSEAQRLVETYASYAPDDERIPQILVDAYHPKLFGGTGEEANLEVALAVKEMVPRMMLAGGLKPSNIQARIETIQPWGVDVASGVESSAYPGIKDAAMVRAFIANVRMASE